MLYTKCIITEPEKSDGTRISVMSRHTLNDGITPDPRITLDKYNEWLREVAPPSKLIGGYYKRNLKWDDFEPKYLQYLRSPEISPKVKELAERAMNSDITLLCIEATAKYCHRRLLAEECQFYETELRVEHIQ